jgi:hypothetical protein
MLLEIGACQFDRMTRKDRLLASSAVRDVAKPLLRDTVGRIAVRTDEMQWIAQGVYFQFSTDTATYLNPYPLSSLSKYKQ